MRTSSTPVAQTAGLFCLVTAVLLGFAGAPARAQLSTPGETSGAPLAPLLVTGVNPTTGGMNVTYHTSCSTVDNNVYIGLLDQVSSLSWSREECGIGTSGTLSEFNPGGGSYFFVIVGNNGTEEGSYGRSSVRGPAGERPPYVASSCGQVQDLSNTCSPATQGVICSTSADCPGRQTCVQDGTAPPRCQCLEPFDGAYCETCAPGYDGPDCRECSDGFLSNALELAGGDDLPEDVTDPARFQCRPDVPGSCDERTCSATGVCRVVEDGSVCACDPGYAGTDCGDCAPNFELDGFGACVLADLCRDAKCGGNGDCIATPFGEVACDCDPGYSGGDCGGPVLAIRTQSERFTLYDGEKVVLQPAGGIGPFDWVLLEGPGTVVECDGLDPLCPLGGAELSIVAPAGGIRDLTLVQVAVFDGAGNQSADDFVALPPGVLPFTGDIHGELLPYYSAMLEYMKRRGIRAGVLGISKGGVVVGVNGYGYRDAGLDADPWVNAAEGGPLVLPGSPFRIASVSKPLTAAAVRDAADDIGVDITSSSPINRAATWIQQSIGFDLVNGAPPFDYNLLVPGATDSRWPNVTIRHLINHHAGYYRDQANVPASTTGQPAYNAGLLPFTWDWPDPTQLQVAKSGSSNDISYATMYAVAALQLVADPRPTVENMIRFSSGIRFHYNPGGDTSGGDNYSNTGYIMLGRVLEGLKGETYDPDEPGVPMGWGAFPNLLQDYLCEASGITTGIYAGDAFQPQFGEPYYRSLAWNGAESFAWNLAEGGDKIRFFEAVQQWQFCQSGCSGPITLWSAALNTPNAYGGIWLAERNSAGGIVATTEALLKFARNHRVRVGFPGSGSTGIGSLLPAPGNYPASSSHNGSLSGTRSWLWQMGGQRTNFIPQDGSAWEDDPTAPLDLDGNGLIQVNENLLGSICTLPSDVAVAVMFNQREDQRAPTGNVSPLSSSSNGTVYGRILDYLADATCQVEGSGWPALGDAPAELAVIPTCN